MLLQLKNVSKIYKLGEQEIHALREVTLNIDAGDFVAIMGPSGSGKSTLLQVMSMLGTPSKGEIFLKKKNVAHYNETERAHLRNREIGFIFQQFNLLPKTSALDNVSLPLLYAGLPKDEQFEKAKKMLEKVGLGDRLDNSRAQLSGGQQQRVAIARALVNNPALIFADEPTGNLDSKTGEEIKKLLIDLNKEGKTIIMVTHEEDVAEIADRFILIGDGEILFDDNYGWNKHLVTKQAQQTQNVWKKRLKKKRKRKK